MAILQALEMEETESFLDASVKSSPALASFSSSRSGAAPKAQSSHPLDRRWIFYVAAFGTLLVLYFGNWSPAQDDTATPLLPNGGAEAVPAPAPGAPSSSQTDTVSPIKPQGPLLYSKMATIVPDPEHVPVNATAQAALADAWGRWHFWDGDEDSRPTADYCAEYENRDIPGDEFPDEAWQVDAVFVNHLLNDAEQLLQRAQEAIFTEYGHGKPLPPEGLAARLKMFAWEKLDLLDPNETPPEGYGGRARNRGSNGGWTTESGFDGLVRRLLHAMHTNDQFVVVLGGHSAAAGHGNHFHQSYAMQFHRVVAPVLARLGVKLVTRNLAMGGLGTVQQSLGSQSLYGSDIDLLWWDSGMTEPQSSLTDLFVRHALMSPGKVPVVWGGGFDILQPIFQQTGADVGEFGTGMLGIPVVTSEEQAMTIPYPARYMLCDKDVTPLCQEDRFCGMCWVDRDDVDKSQFTEIHEIPGARVKWHPGWRSHQWQGRVLAYAVLEALQVAIQRWSDGTMGGPPLEDALWHVTAHYNSIRDKVRTVQGGECRALDDLVSPRVCSTPMKGATLFTPRANPEETSLTKLIKPAPNGYVPTNQRKVLYDGPDRHNECYDVKEGGIDILAIISGRRRLEEQVTPSGPTFSDWRSTHESGTDTEKPLVAIISPQRNASRSERRAASDAIVPGKGWQVVSEMPGQCDGEYHSVCGRHVDISCPMLGHHDGRGVLVGNEYSGWIVLNLPKVTEGLIIIKLFTWGGEGMNTITQGWTTVNNEGGRRLRGSSNFLQKEENLSRWNESSTTIESEKERYGGELDERRLDPKSIENYPNAFEFDYAINGKITTLNRDQFRDRVKDLARVVEVMTLLDDPDFVSGPTDVEIAFRMRNCGHLCTVSLTHVYWA
jgi:hypothetical protein